MTTVDLIVLGTLKKKALSVYDIRKLVGYRNTSRWVRISTPFIHEKVIQLEEKGYIKNNLVGEGKMPERATYSLTETGEKEFERLMYEITSQPIRIFLGFNAVTINLPQLSSEDRQPCFQGAEGNIKVLKSFLEENIREEEQSVDVPETGMAVLCQQYMLAGTMETWIASLKRGGCRPARCRQTGSVAIYSCCSADPTGIPSS